MESWKVASEIAGVASTVVAIVGVVLVVRQIKSGNKALRSGAYQGMVANSFTLISNVLNDEAMLKAIGPRIFPGPQAPSSDDLRWHFMALAIMRHYENLFVQHALGSITDNQWKGYHGLLSWYLKKDAFRTWWNGETRLWFSPDFSHEVDRLTERQLPPARAQRVVKG